MDVEVVVREGRVGNRGYVGRMGRVWARVAAVGGFLWTKLERRIASRVLNDCPGSHMGIRKAHELRPCIRMAYSGELAPRAKPRLAWISSHHP